MHLPDWDLQASLLWLSAIDCVQLWRLPEQLSELPWVQAEPHPDGTRTVLWSEEEIASGLTAFRRRLKDCYRVHPSEEGDVLRLTDGRGESRLRTMLADYLAQQVFGGDDPASRQQLDTIIEAIHIPHWPAIWRSLCKRRPQLQRPLTADEVRRFQEKEWRCLDGYDLYFLIGKAARPYWNALHLGRGVVPEGYFGDWPISPVAAELLMHGIAWASRFAGVRSHLDTRPEIRSLPYGMPASFSQSWPHPLPEQPTIRDFRVSMPTTPFGLNVLRGIYGFLAMRLLMAGPRSAPSLLTEIDRTEKLGFGISAAVRLFFSRAAHDGWIVSQSSDDSEPILSLTTAGQQIVEQLPAAPSFSLIDR